MKRKRGRGRGAAILALMLILVTAGIILLAVFLPRREKTDSAPSFAGRSVYFLVSGEATGQTRARALAQQCAERGGAGYLFNDGTYRAVAAVYKNVSDALALASVNDGASCYTLTLPAAELSHAELAAVSYALGEWLDIMYTTSTELDRGTITDAGADIAASSACRTLRRLARAAAGEIGDALAFAAEYSPAADDRSLLSYLRFISVRAVVCVYGALS